MASGLAQRKWVAVIADAPPLHVVSLTREEILAALRPGEYLEIRAAGPIVVSAISPAPPFRVLGRG